ncbi:MAG: DUF1573 domain-containing protein [bacterium]
MRTRLFMSIILALLLISTVRAGDPERVIYDFGHVGIDFVVYHTYPYVNQSDTDIRVSKVDVQCDCTRVALVDSTAGPGDTLFFRTSFSTKDYFGPTARSFVVSLEGNDGRDIEFQHRATVGQWYYNLKPDPISLFFLPSHRSKKITIPNTEHPGISASLFEQADDYYEIKIVKREAAKGDEVSLEVIPRSDLGPGTYLSSFTMAVSVEGGSKPALLTVPLKIVKY